MPFLVAFILYILAGILISLAMEYRFGSRERFVNTVLDIVAWPILVMYWLKS